MDKRAIKSDAAASRYGAHDLESTLELLETNIPLPTKFGDFTVHLFRSTIDQKEHLALSRGLPEVSGPRTALEATAWVRLHSECLTGDVLHSLRCDCGAQLEKALGILSQKDLAVLVYLREEGRGIGLANKLHAYRLQDEGLDTVEANAALGFPADLRNYEVGAQILRYLGVRKANVLTNNPDKIEALTKLSIEVIAREPLEIAPNPANIDYLTAKRDKLGHTLQAISKEKSEPQ